MTTFNHPLGAQARRRNFVLLGAIIAATFGRLAKSLRNRLVDRPPGTRPMRDRAARRAAEAAYWVDNSLRAWPRAGWARRPDPV